ncbi:MAG: hypothetical protein ACOYK9_03725 [Chlamydiia bacterium]
MISRFKQTLTITGRALEMSLNAFHSEEQRLKSRYSSVVGAPIWLNEKVKRRFKDTQVSDALLRSTYSTGFHGTSNVAPFLEELRCARKAPNGSILVKGIGLFYTDDTSEARTYTVLGSNPAIIALEIKNEASHQNVCPMHHKNYISENAKVEVLAIFKKGDKISREAIIIESAKKGLYTFLEHIKMIQS